jgi:queuine tRNA-ribosyltransferase
MEYPGFGFEIIKKDTATEARSGFLNTPHGGFETPNFIFCATKAAIKGAGPKELSDIGADVILSNTYHLMLRPGPDLVEKMGGLHRFMGWNGPMLTDSGGYQIFSLGHGSVSDEIKGKRNGKRNATLKKITEEGALFQSYVDGSDQFLTPERSMEIQRKLGADMILVMDECTPFHVDKRYTEKSMLMSHRWADRCVEEFQRAHTGTQSLFGIVQGGVYEDLRRQSSEYVSSRPFFGHSIGGSLGATKAQMYEVVGYALKYMRRDRPIHLLGIGGPEDIWENVENGVDFFDCVSPTRLARHGTVLVRTGKKHKLNLLNAKFREDQSPLDEECDCYACRNFTRAYLHYLFKAQELEGLHLVTIHNMRFMTRLMKTVRDAIKADRFTEAKREWLGR